LSGPLSLGMFSLGMFRSATGLAQNAIQSISQGARSLADSAGDASADPAKSFASVLSSDPSAPTTTVAEIRQKLASAIESVLAKIGIPADPAMTFSADQDGAIRLESDHERTVEIEGTLNEDAAVRELTNQLAANASGADRRLVLHSIAAT
jgi:hypothetical protein